MRFASSIVLPLLSLGASLAAASPWGFEDATVSISTKGTGVGGAFKEKLSPHKQLSKDVALGAADTLKVILTTTEGDAPKRPHQAFLSIREPKTGLEESFPFSIKESGKGKVEVTQKDLPVQLLTAGLPLEAKIVIASFGSSTAYYKKAFEINVGLDPNAPIAVPEAPTRYGKLAEIHHIFRADPQSPPKIVSTVFALAIAATFPVLLGAWLLLGANVNHVSKALSADPASHALFFGSIASLEGIFFLYYTSWNLFQTLPAAALFGVIAFVSGGRALSEVQARRLAGLR
ncbi:Oligosaccharyltransferase subunit Ribophorin II-domain-containing protein [Delphinella strobiligena]|nr:Oligosaccharyltransferase subunit Ribophorin II-domain-containing protein [Delphinella strobiligena]